MKAFSVYYSGGSAGCFFTLTLALASQKTHFLSSTESIQEIINKSWKHDDASNWDKYLIPYDYQYQIPDNSYDDMANEKQYYPMSNGKLPIIKYDQPPHLINDNTNSILIYTDVDTHFALMEMKRVAFFNPVFWANSDYYKKDEDRSYWRWGGDPILNKEDFFNDHLSRTKHSFAHTRLSFPYKQMRVLKRFNVLFFNDVDYRFLLQDVIKTKFKCVTDALGLEHNQEVVEHVEHWVSLHPDNIQRMFYK